MSHYPYTNSFALIRSILILIVVFGIIGSISQLVSGLFALANAQDHNGTNHREKKPVGECFSSDGKFTLCHTHFVTRLQNLEL